MTPEELKWHRREICAALIDGKQCQMMVTGQWTDQNPQTAACNLFSDWKPEFIRIKPEPRKLWVGWPKDKSDISNWVSTRNPSEFDNDFRLKYNWQLVEEPE